MSAGPELNEMKGGVLAMGGRARVHELAKELGVTSREVLAVLRKQGQFVKSASSPVEAGVARRVRETFSGRTSTHHATDADPRVFGPTVANLVAELGVSDKAIIGYLRHLGADVRNASSAIPPHLAEQTQKRFATASNDSTERCKSLQPKADVLPSLPNTKSASEPPTPPYFFIHHLESSVVHHLDYLSKSADRTLCGSQNVEPREATSAGEPGEVCPECVAKLPEYHALWWFGQYRSISAELAKLQTDYRRLQAHSDEQQKHISKLLQKSGQATPVRNKANPPAGGKKKRSQQRKAVITPGTGGRQKAKSAPLPAKRVPRVPDPEVVRRRIQEMNAPRRPRTEAEKRSDEAARESMRSHKPSSWRIGRSPSRNG